MTSQPRPKAYSYLRFSTPSQSEGDSFRRQTALAASYAAQHDLDLDTSLTFHDLGISAFRGDNAETGRLADFREAVRAGQVQRGSYLLVESLDRLSRLTPRKALRVLEDIIEAGIAVVTLNDGKVYTEQTLEADPVNLMLAILYFMRANEESETKARRLKAAWVGKRQDALAKNLKLTAVVPAWLTLNADRKTFTVIEDRADVVRSVFQQIASGAGLESIAKELNESRVPVFGRGKQWHRSYIQKLRDNPAVIGTFVPHQTMHTTQGKARKPLDPILEYYPAIVEPTLFEQVSIVAAGKVPKISARTGIQSILAGLAKCPVCGSTMTRVSKGSTTKGGKPKFVCTRAKLGAGCKYHGVSQEQVEATIRNEIIPLLAQPPLSDESAQDALEHARNSLEVAEDEVEGLIRAIAMKPVPALLERLEMAQVGLDDLKATIKELEAAAALSNHVVIESRAAHLWALLQDEAAATSKINAAMRALFKSVTIDYQEGQLWVEWHHGPMTNFYYTFPE